MHIIIPLLKHSILLSGAHHSPLQEHNIPFSRSEAFPLSGAQHPLLWGTASPPLKAQHPFIPRARHPAFQSKASPSPGRSIPSRTGHRDAPRTVLSIPLPIRHRLHLPLTRHSPAPPRVPAPGSLPAPCRDAPVPAPLPASHPRAGQRTAPPLHRTSLTYPDDMRHPMRAVSPEASEQESRAVFPEHAAERRPRLGHRRAGRGAAALRPQGQRGGGLRPGAQPERPPMAHRSERVVPSRAAPSRAQPSLAEPCGSKASRAVSSRAEPGGTCGVGLSVRPQERLCPLLPLMRAALTKPRSGACTHAHSHTRTRAHTRTDTLTPGGCGNGPPRRLLRVPTHSVPLSPVSPPCPRCPRRVPSMSPLSPRRGDAGALCPRSGVPGVSDAR